MSRLAFGTAQPCAMLARPCLLEPPSGTWFRTWLERTRSRETADLHRHPRVDLGRLDEAVDLEVLAELDVHQAGRGAVVDRRHAVARECRRVAEPTRHVAARRLTEHLLVRSVDRGDQLVTLVDLAAGRGHVDLPFDPVVGIPRGERP